MDGVSSLNLALPTAGTGVPEWVHLVPAGTFNGADGRGPYNLKDPAGVIAASMTAQKLPFDENHSTQRAAAIGAPSPARGWIIDLQNRDDGIWGKVDWSGEGTAIMTQKSYRYVSPVFGYGADGTVKRIISAALTNDPNLTLTALHTKTGDDMDKTAICTALGLTGAMGDAEIMTALQTAASAKADLTGAKTELAAAQAEIVRLKATTAPVTDVVALQTRVNAMEADGKQKAAVTFIDAAIKAGKPIAAVRDQFIAQHCADAATTEAMVNGLVSINARGAGGGNPAIKPGEAGQAEMTAEETAICSRMGVDPGAYAKKFKTNEGSAA